jgi:hypothetical protein
MMRWCCGGDDGVRVQDVRVLGTSVAWTKVFV